VRLVTERRSWRALRPEPSHSSLQTSLDPSLIPIEKTQTHTGRIKPKRGTEPEEEMVGLVEEKEEEGDIEKEEPLI
jgi:hypothetical protein